MSDQSGSSWRVLNAEQSGDILICLDFDLAGARQPLGEAIAAHFRSNQIWSLRRKSFDLPTHITPVDFSRRIAQHLATGTQRVVGIVSYCCAWAIARQLQDSLSPDTDEGTQLPGIEIDAVSATSQFMQSQYYIALSRLRSGPGRPEALTEELNNVHIERGDVWRLAMHLGSRYAEELKKATHEIGIGPALVEELAGTFQLYMNYIATCSADKTLPPSDVTFAINSYRHVAMEGIASPRSMRLNVPRDHLLASDQFRRLMSELLFSRRSQTSES